MKRVLGWIFNRWVLAAVVLGALALVIHIIGPMVAIGEWRPLEQEQSRWITIGVLGLLCSWLIRIAGQALMPWLEFSKQGGRT